VRALWGDVKEMPLSAVELRERDAVLLDLRGNGGGADSYAVEWCSRFSRQGFRLYTGFAAFHAGAEHPIDRWSCELALELPEAEAGSSAMPDEPYGGRLVVLVDSGTASSGESFTALASQIPGATVVGENTAGAITYGNVDQSVELPHSKLWVRGGRTKFVPAGREVREALGAFPDFWLDTAAPELAITEYLGLTD
jgi:C-terminal processing protease CtpA/Prc